MPRSRSRSPDYSRRHHHGSSGSKRDRETSHRERESYRERDYGESKRRRYEEDGDDRGRGREYHSRRDRDRDRDYRSSRREEVRPGRSSRREVDSPRSTRSGDASPRVERERERAPREVDRAPVKPEVPPAASTIPSETDEERKQREKRQRLEAWKAKKAQEKQQSAQAQQQQSDLPTKPVSSAPIPKPAVKVQPAKLSTVSARLGVPSNANASAPTAKRAKATNFMDDAEEEEHTSGASGNAMFKPESFSAQDIDMAPSQAEEEDAGLDFDDADAADERAEAERQRQERELERSRANDPDATPLEQGSTSTPPEDQQQQQQEKARPQLRREIADTKPETDAMQVDNAAADEEEDELDAYMNSVTAEVKQINAQDQSKGVHGAPKEPASKGVKVSGGDEADDADAQGVAELDDYEKVGLNAQEIMALAAKKLKRRELTAVDHSKVAYEPFRKAFYHAPPEVQDLSEEEANLLRLQLDGIKIRGVDCPKPITKWSHCGLPAVVLDVIRSNGFESPTPIQTQAIPAIMSGRDMIGVAKTGSGKTLAFLLPLFRHIKDQRPLTSQEGPIAMIMTPTRELAVQIHRECKPFLKALNLRACSLYGGSPLKDNIAELKRGVEIVVCTPGRMIELLTTNSGKIISMKRVSYLVLDEADRMFDMGFEPQVTKILGQIRPDRQTVLFSATFPKQMEGLARKILKKPLEITVGGRSTVAKEIEQFVEVREEDSKFRRLLEILGRFSNEDPEGLVLIFVDRQESADDLFKELMKHHYVCQSIHGAKEQVDRDQTIQDFKAGIVPIVIATSVAARGLDVKQLKLVINYDAPNHMEDYVHRAGRTGRAGNKGTCITFIEPDQEKYSVDLYRALEASGATIPDPLREMAEGFLSKVKSGNAKLAGSGFGGKGLDRFEKDREATRKAERSAYGPDAETEEERRKRAETTGEAEGEAEQDVEAKMAEHNMPDLNVEIRSGPAPENHRKGLMQLPTTGGDVLKVAEAQAAKAGKTLDAKERARLVAQSLNASLRQKRMEHNLHDDPFRQQASSGHSDATAFHAIVPINDYPQKARWKVTNKETMSSLTENSGASVTNKGVFYEKGHEPKSDDDPPKLHLLIESNDEHKVKMAIQEIKHILVDAAAAALEAETRNQPGRYTV